jgi:adenylate cyclase
MQQRVACLHADVSGYCRLVASDLTSTVRTLTAYRTVMSRMVDQHRGRVVDTAGDSLLATFRSASDALRCAVDIQRELETQNAGLPPNRRLKFRVGIDLGEVLVEGGRVYGDCVNIAARVQQVAPAGSIYLAGSAYDQLDAWPLRCEYLGERMVRSIERPQRLYCVE